MPPRRKNRFTYVTEFDESTVAGPKMSSLKETSVIVASAVAVSVLVTYFITKRREETKQRAIIVRQYEREKFLKEKTAEARKKADEPLAGTLLEDIKVEKVFLWECEDLRKKFPSAQVLNVMKNIATQTPFSVRSPLLRMGSSSVEFGEQKTTKHETNYNKLVTDHECILGDIIRKPNRDQQTVAYMRAGPRKLLHFDPKEVNAAIVTCGGLCPGLNNVIREITKTLHQIYGIGGTVYGIQGGFRGFHDPSPTIQPLILTPELVENIHHEGGTVLGSSRGGFDLEKIIHFIQAKKISQLYGTLHLIL